MSIRDAFLEQSENCAALGSPFMGRLLALLADRLSRGTPVAEKILTWPGDPRAHADNVPLRLGGALHALKLEGLALEDVYPPFDVPDDLLWSGVYKAMQDHAPRLMTWLDNPPQTNEVRRSAAILPALAAVRARFDLPVALFELGCSGGLNLRPDIFRLEIAGTALGPSDAPVVFEPEWRGAMPQPKVPTIVGRFGVDLNPIDPTTSDGKLRLLSYLWADQPDRIARTRSAIDLATTHPAEISKGDAGDWLPRVLNAPEPGVLRFVFHTVAAQYFPKSTKDAVQNAMDAAARTATANTPLAHFQMEADGGSGARLSLAMWPDGEQLELGRADFHGRWIEWAGLSDLKS